MPPRGTLRNPKLKKATPRQLQVIPHLRKGRSPCHGCKLDRAGDMKIKPKIPKDVALIVVGLHPDKKAEREKVPFVGDGGAILRNELNKNGLYAGKVVRLPKEPNTGEVMDLDDPRITVGFANLTRCRPENNEGDFGTNTPEWEDAAERCAYYLAADVQGDCPLLILGTKALDYFTSEKKASMSRYRGMRHLTATGRVFFVTWHPIGAKRHYEQHGSTKKFNEFRKDIKAVADYILGGAKPPKVKVHVFENPGAAKSFLKAFAKHDKPWAFDIEAYDAGEFPARKFVSTDPYHPDFRVRGVAIAWNPKEGAWIDFKSWQNRREEASKLLSPVFASSAEKYDFNGTYDEEALVYNGWVSRVRRRTCDGMLGLQAINGGGLSGFSLARATVDLLGEPQYWDVDKARIERITLDKLAESAVRDTISTLKLGRVLIAKLRRGDYIMGEEE